MGPLINEGAFGRVFECRGVWGTELAAKVVKPTGTYEAVRDRAIAEFQKLVALRHPNITFVHDAFEYRDTFFFITERCHFTASELFTIPRFDGMLWIMPIARSALQAIHYVHINGFVHQDVHIGNVLAAYARDELMEKQSDAMQFKLADLGIAKLAYEVNTQNTRARWMLPPEVLKPDEYGPTDRRVDIYHVGLLLLQLAVSQRLTFTTDEVLAGKPCELALTLPQPAEPEPTT